MSFANKASFPLDVTGNITLYAKWEENEPAGITFTVNGSGTLTAVEGISESNSEVIIPSEVNGIAIKQIGQDLFRDNPYLRKLSIPDGVSLGYRMSSGCSSLYSITMPSQAIAIESTAFYGAVYCNDPSSWDSGVLYVDSYLVATNADFASVSSYAVKPGTIAIAEKAFANNGKKLESITLPDGLLFIGDGAFSSLSSLKTANIPSSVTRIGYGVFSGTAFYKDTANWEGHGLYLDSWLLAVENVKITEFAVREGAIGAVDGNDASLFPSRAKSVATLFLPSSLRYVGARSFAQLKVTSLILPESLQSIGEAGFASCAFLVSANLSDCLNLISIGDQAFSGASLGQITIPSSVLTMGELVFNQNRVDLSIHFLVESKPDGWDGDWAYSYKEGVSMSVSWVA